MTRRTVLTSPTGRRVALNTAALPVSFWPQTAAPAFSTRWSALPQPKVASELPIDVFAGAEEAVVRAGLPGVQPENIEVSVYENTVTISAQIPARSIPEGEQVAWLVSELGSGAFQRTIQLPFQIEEREVEAEFANGLLQLTLPKVEAEKPHRISIRVRPQIDHELGQGEQQEDESFAAD